MNAYKKIFIVCLGVFVLQIISSIANAETNEQVLFSLDIDSDGLISLREASANKVVLDNFNTIDINDDGYISMDELLASKIFNDTK